MNCTPKDLSLGVRQDEADLSGPVKKRSQPLMYCDVVAPETGFIPGSNALWGMPPTASKPHSNFLCHRQGLGQQETSKQLDVKDLILFYLSF